MRIVYRNKEKIVNPETGVVIPLGKFFTLKNMTSKTVELGLYSLEKYMTVTMPREIFDNEFERIGIFP